jgi:Icc protein
MLVAQITDTHIVAKSQHWLGEPSTQVSQRLAKVVDFLNALDPLPDVVLMTGDLVEAGDLPAYHHFKELMSSLKIPYYVIPGNHDRREALRSAFAGESYLPKEGFIHYVIEDYPVRLIGLDTLVEGENYGRICQERLAWLRSTLSREPTQPALIFMHHPPVKVGTKLFDRMNCSTSSEFKNLIMAHDSLLGIVSGHYHHLCISSFGGKCCFIAPSVAPVHYFAHPNVDDVTALELENPGVALHRWLEGSPLISHVKWVKEQDQRIDWKTIRQRLKCTVLSQQL